MAYIATIGFFDGVHCGHRYLIQQLLNESRKMYMSSLILTFSQHPRSVIEHQMPELLYTTQERRSMLLHTNVDQVHFFDFEAIRDLSAKHFLQFIHHDFQVNVLMMGYDHHFGCDHPTDINEYIRLGEHTNVKIIPVPISPDGNISSTKIRHALQEGRLDDANRMLGYPYTITGEVIHGHHLGTQLGFPTANLNLPKDKLIPAKGVYAALVNRHKALVNIGTNPTFGENAPLTVEVHIPNYVANLYGQMLSVQLMEYIRPEQHFASPQLLIEQIHHDMVHLDQLEL